MQFFPYLIITALTFTLATATAMAGEIEGVTSDRKVNALMEVPTQDGDFLGHLEDPIAEVVEEDEDEARERENEAEDTLAAEFGEPAITVEAEPYRPEFTLDSPLPSGKVEDIVYRSE